MGGLLRSYQLIRPERPVASRLPAIVFLHGINSDIGEEEARDGLLPIAAAGQVVLAYPVGYGESWNAGSCCGAAELHGLDDVALVTAVEQRVAADPGVDPDRVATANGVLLTPVTSVVATWRDRDGCAGAPALRWTGRLRMETWGQCRARARVALATYTSGGHHWPAGDGTTPPAGQVVWDFVNATS